MSAVPLSLPKRGQKPAARAPDADSVSRAWLLDLLLAQRRALLAQVGSLDAAITQLRAQQPPQ
jgi:hypothetical protein